MKKQRGSSVDPPESPTSSLDPPPRQPAFSKHGTGPHEFLGPTDFEGSVCEGFCLQIHVLSLSRYIYVIEHHRAIKSDDVKQIVIM